MDAGILGGMMDDECGCCDAACQCGDCVDCTEAPIRIPFGPVMESGRYRPGVR